MHHELVHIVVDCDSFDVLAFLNGVYTLSLCYSRAGMRPLATFTIWSWCILTFRCGSSALCAFFPSLPFLPFWSEFVRFPALVAATVTFFIWNFVLLPMIYFVFFKEAERRKKFLAWNFRFELQEIHIFNFPIAVVNVILSGGARRLTSSDLWVSYLYSFSYSLWYLLVLDR